MDAESLSDTYKFHPAMPIDLLCRNPLQPRKNFDAEELDSLANSIKQVGVMQPIVARPSSNGGNFEIIAGERRWRASQMVGLSEVPVIVRHVNDMMAVTMAMMENLERADLNPIEEAAGYQLLSQEYGLTHKQIAESFSHTGKGVRRDRVSRMLRLFQLPVQLQNLVRDGKIEFSHAEILLSDDVQKVPGLALKLGRKCANEGLSKRQLRHLVSVYSSGNKPVKSNDEKKDISWIKLEERYTDYFGSPFAINKKGSGLQVVIDCQNMDILEGVLSKLDLPEE